MRPEEYEWGVYALPNNSDTVAFGEHKGSKVWESVPQEYRTLLLEHIRVQGDAENASIEQSRSLTRSAPSGADMDNLFQFYLEEGRHSWSMVYLLHAYFSQDGAVEADGLLQRLSGDAARPRLLSGFNTHTEDWLSHFIWCFMADRVGKYQVQAVTQASFAPLARMAKFMMLEEPLHIAFGTRGLERILCRAIEVTLERDTLEVLPFEAIPIPTIQRFLNHWTPKVYDLFGSDQSQRAYDLHQAGLRTSHELLSDDPLEAVTIDVRRDDRVESVDVVPERAINACLRRQHRAEVNRVVERWNVALRRAGIDYSLRLPHERFMRAYGPCAGLQFDPEGNPMPEKAAYERMLARCLPTESEFAAVRALMTSELRESRHSAWIASPTAGLRQLVERIAQNT